MRIVVVGAGPAGSSAAYHLAIQGHDVVLLAPEEPSEKVCGGGVPVKCLNRFPYFYKDFSPAQKLFNNILFSFDGIDLCSVPMNGGMGIFSRRHHDSHIFRLAQKVGASFVRGRFKSCNRQGETWHVETDAGVLLADYLIGADGATSRVRNLLSSKLPRESYFKGHDYLVKRTDLPLHVGFDKKLNGYLWVFPRESDSSIGIVDFSESRGERLELLESYMAKFAIEPTDIIKKRSAVIPSLRKEDLRNHCIGGDDWALVGDAAGLAEPLTGEGIYYALYSGWLIGHCLEKDMNYNEEWRHYFTQIVEETSISRIAYKWVNTGIAKAVLKRSRLMRSLMGDQLAAQRSGRYYRVKLFIFLPLILVQTLFSRAQKVH